MRTPLSQSQLGVYYACVANNDPGTNYQNPILLDLPVEVNVEKVREAVYQALCAHPYLASRVVLDDEGVPGVQSGAFPPAKWAETSMTILSATEGSSSV